MNRRRFGRREVFKSATILTDAGLKVPCMVINQSDGGLALKDPLCELPPSFFIIFEEEDKIVRCQIIHQTGEAIGVQFVNAPRPASTFDLSWHLKRRRLLQQALV